MKKTTIVAACALAASAAVAQDPAVEARLRALEEQNRAILAALEKSEAKNAEMAAELGKVRDDAASSARESAVETQVNALSARMADGITWKDLVKSGNKMKFYGFIRLDAYGDTGRMDNIILPTFVAPETNADNTDDASFAFDARLTRIGIDFDFGKIGTADTTAKIEMDFSNTAGTVIQESRSAPRIRLGYVNLDYGTLALRFGQDWDTISPLMPAVNGETLMWNAGNLGDRRAQATAMLDFGDPAGTAWQWKTSFGLTGAINNQDLETTSTTATIAERDGFDSGMPNIQSRLGVVTPSWVDGKKLASGVWGAFGKLETDTLYNNQDRFDSWVVGADLTVPLFGGVALKGEVWTGQALGDFRGGIGQVLTVSATRADEIAAQGGWAELAWATTPELTLAAGGSVDSADEDDLSLTSTTAKSKNWSLYLNARYDWGGGLKTGVDVIYWETQYANGTQGNLVRTDLYIQIDF